MSSAPDARAVRVAGMLAELGVLDLTLHAPATPPHLETHTPRVRESDLPGMLTALLERHGSCVVAAPGLRLTLAPGTIIADTGEARIAAHLARVLPECLVRAGAPHHRAGAADPPA